jgi:hypothetical protein
MTTDEEKRRSYHFLYKTQNPNLAQLEIKLYVLTAEQTSYYLTDDDGTSFARFFFARLNYLMRPTLGEILDKFSLACIIKGDMSNMAGALVKRETTNGILWILNFNVGISFGATEISARLIWKDAKVSPVRSPTSRLRLIRRKI